MDINLERAWSAGFLEGEGSFTSVTRHKGKYRYLQVQAHQVEIQPLERLQSLWGGRIWKRDRQSKVFADGYSRKDIYIWEVIGSSADILTEEIYSFLSDRRKKQIDDARARILGSVPDTAA